MVFEIASLSELFTAVLVPAGVVHPHTLRLRVLLVVHFHPFSWNFIETLFLRLIYLWRLFQNRVFGPGFRILASFSYTGWLCQILPELVYAARQVLEALGDLESTSARLLWQYVDWNKGCV